MSYPNSLLTFFLRLASPGPTLKIMALCLTETTLFYHNLRASATPAPSAAFPTTKSAQGLIGNWSDQVADAARSTPSLSHSYNSSRSRVSMGYNSIASGSRAGGKYDIGDDTLPSPAPAHKANTPNLTASFFFSLAPCSYWLAQLNLKCKVDPDVTISPAPTSYKKHRKVQYPLPPGAEDDNTFRGVFIPTYERWVGMQDDPWAIPDDVAIRTLQTIWDSIYLAVPWTVKANDCVFERVRLSLSRRVPPTQDYD